MQTLVPFQGLLILGTAVLIMPILQMGKSKAGDPLRSKAPQLAMGTTWAGACRPEGRTPKPERYTRPGPGPHGASPSFLPAARLATSLEGFDIASVQQQRQEQSYFVRLGSLSERLRQRAYAHSLGKLQLTRQRAQEALLQLAQALSLVRPRPCPGGSAHIPQPPAPATLRSHPAPSCQAFFYLFSKELNSYFSLSFSLSLSLSLSLFAELPVLSASSSLFFYFFFFCRERGGEGQRENPKQVLHCQLRATN